jgi:hypothetical protein
MTSVQQALEKHITGTVPDLRARSAVESGLSHQLAPLALVLPAGLLRYLQEEKAREVLALPSPPFPPSPSFCFAAICGGEDAYEEDSYLFYIESVSGKVVKEHVFRFPDLFYFGTSADW